MVETLINGKWSRGWRRDQMTDDVRTHCHEMERLAAEREHETHDDCLNNLSSI